MKRLTQYANFFPMRRGRPQTHPILIWSNYHFRLQKAIADYEKVVEMGKMGQFPIDCLHQICVTCNEEYYGAQYSICPQCIAIYKSLNSR